MNYESYLCILDCKSEEVDALTGGIYLGLLGGLGLPKSGRCQDLPAILGGQEVSYAKENGCSVFKRSALPLLLSCHSCVNGCLDQLLYKEQTYMRLCACVCMYVCCVVCACDTHRCGIVVPGHDLTVFIRLQVQDTKSAG